MSTMEPKSPKWVPICTERDFYDKSLHDLRREVFGKYQYAVIDSAVRGYLEAYQLLVEVDRCLRLDMCFAVIDYADKARIWNRAMKRIRYTEVYDA